MKALWLIAGLIGSIAVTGLLWAFGHPGFFLFFALPLLWWPSRRRADRRLPRCPTCGWSEPGAVYCPHHGERLVEAADDLPGKP